MNNTKDLIEEAWDKLIRFELMLEGFLHECKEGCPNEIYANAIGDEFLNLREIIYNAKEEVKE